MAAAELALLIDGADDAMHMGLATELFKCSGVPRATEVFNCSSVELLLGSSSTSRPLKSMSYRASRSDSGIGVWHGVRHARPGTKGIDE